MTYRFVYLASTQRIIFRGPVQCRIDVDTVRRRHRSVFRVTDHCPRLSLMTADWPIRAAAAACRPITTRDAVTSQTIRMKCTLMSSDMTVLLLLCFVPVMQLDSLCSANDMKCHRHRGGFIRPFFSARYLLWPCVTASVCLSVRLSVTIR